MIMKPTISWQLRRLTRPSPAPSAAHHVSNRSTDIQTPSNLISKRSTKTSAISNAIGASDSATQQDAPAARAATDATADTADKHAFETSTQQLEDTTVDDDEQEDPDAHEGFYDTRFFKLVDLGNGEATLEIDGVQMHITASKPPSQDAKDKVKLARVRRGHRVLDVCTGLGYSAQAAARAGAAEVITIEKEPSVLAVARQNPGSQGVFTDPAIKIINANAFDAIQTFPDAHFSAAMHDPPRLSHAGELYSQEFYNQLHRILRSGGRLFHYTGSPGKKAGKNIPSGIKGRLAKAGFREVRWVDSCQGFVATKY